MSDPKQEALESLRNEMLKEIAKKKKKKRPDAFEDDDESDNDPRALPPVIMSGAS